MKKGLEMTADEIFAYQAIFERDSRLNVWHLALLFAILILGYKQGEHCRIKVSRSKIMALAHVRTLTTYHKYFKELQELGYIKYTPSYHPGYRSEVELLQKTCI
jgi:hypothetical protein